jgi:hypothetical protein
MKDIILEVLGKKGSLSLDKLWKKVCKKSTVDGEAEETRVSFDKSVQNLVDEKDVINSNGEISLNKAKRALPQRNMKRKAGLDSYQQESEVVEEDSTENAPVKKTKKFKYEELWVNGERYWKEGLFDPEYLRTNPDK